MMRRFLFFLFILPILMGCGNRKDTLTIEGKFRGMQEAELLIYTQGGVQAKVDTIHVKNGEFLYTTNAEPTLTAYMLVFPNAVEQVIFGCGGQKLKYEAAGNDLKNYVVKGNEENDLMNEFRQETSKATYTQTREAAKRFIEKNSHSIVAIYLFDRYFVQDEKVSFDTMKPLLDLLLQNQPQNLLLLQVQSSMAAIKHFSVGQKLPKLKLNTHRKRTVDLAHLNRPYTLVAFWATWSVGAWNFIDVLHRIRDQHKEKGDLDIVAVSLDTELYRFEDYTRLDSVGIHHVCDGKAWQSPLVKQLGIRAIPSYLIADRSGKILKVSTQQGDLQKDVEEIVK